MAPKVRDDDCPTNAEMCAHLLPRLPLLGEPVEQGYGRSTALDLVEEGATLHAQLWHRFMVAGQAVSRAVEKDPVRCSVRKTRAMGEFAWPTGEAAHLAAASRKGALGLLPEGGALCRCGEEWGPQLLVVDRYPQPRSRRHSPHAAVGSGLVPGNVFIGPVVHEGDREECFGGHARRQLARLRRECAELRMRCDVLKRSLALWVQDATGR